MKDVRARDLMNPDLLLARESMSVGELATFLTENEISGAPVVDEQGNLTGVVSLADLGRAAAHIGGVEPDRSGPDFYLRGWEDVYAAEDLQRLRVEGDDVQVSAIMTRTIHSVSEDATAADVARAMVSDHVHRLLVTRAADGGPAGIISTMDLLRVMAEA